MLTTEQQATHAALLAEVLAEPADDEPRLVMADFWEEAGEQERSDFIRLQIRRAQWEGKKFTKHCTCGGNGTDTCSRCHEDMWDERRENELLTHCRFWDWFGGIVGNRWTGSPSVGIVGTDCEVGYYDGDDEQRWTLGVRRGFVESLTLAGDDFVRYADAILQQQPIRTVRFTSWPTVAVGSVGMSPYDRDYYAYLRERGRGDGQRVDWDRYAREPRENRERKAVVELVALEWPGIAFHFPDASAGPHLAGPTVHQASTYWGGRRP